MRMLILAGAMRRTAKTPSEQELVVRMYLRAANVLCNAKETLSSCIERGGTESSDNTGRFALLQAAEASSYDASGYLARSISGMTRPAAGDDLTYEWIRQQVRLGLPTAPALFNDFAAAGALNGNRRQALLAEIRKVDRWFTAQSAAEFAVLLKLARELSDHEVRALVRAEIAREFCASFKEPLLEQGVLCIRAGQFAALAQMSHTRRGAFQRDPGILDEWIAAARKSEKSIIPILLAAAPPELYGPTACSEAMESGSGDHKLFVSCYARYGANSRIQDLVLARLGAARASPDPIAFENLWSDVLRVTVASPDAGRFYYWRYRALIDAGRLEEARAIREHHLLLAPMSYYNLLLWDRNSSGFEKAWERVRHRNDYLEWLSLHGGSPAAREFLRARNRDAYLDPAAVRAQAEIAEALRNSDPVCKFVAAEGDAASLLLAGRPRPERILCRLRAAVLTQDVQASATLTREYLRIHGVQVDPYSLPEELLRLIYPRPHRSVIERIGAQYGLPSSLLYAVMKQESMFNPHAVSSAGAVGLMQIMPRTAAMVAAEAGLAAPDLRDPQTNLTLGIRFLSSLYVRYGDRRLALAAYNAGPSRVQQWLALRPAIDIDEFMESLPFAETRSYYRKVLRFAEDYDIIYTLYPDVHHRRQNSVFAVQ